MTEPVVLRVTRHLEASPGTRAGWTMILETLGNVLTA
jgi:hypothetical protein